MTKKDPHNTTLTQKFLKGLNFPDLFPHRHYRADYHLTNRKDLYHV